MMMRFTTLAAAAAATLALSGTATAKTGDELGQCLIANSSADVENAMKEMMIDAFTDDTEALQTSVVDFSIRMITLGVEACDLDVSLVQTPEVQIGIEQYGAYVGEKIMIEAMAKIGAAN